jgi:hypothetical protein
MRFVRGWAAVIVVGGAAMASGCGGGGRVRTAARTSSSATAALTIPVSATPAVRHRRPSRPAVLHRRPSRTAVRHRRPSRRAGFSFRATSLSPALRAEMNRTSWHPGCPVSLDGLRYLRIAYRDFDHRRHMGEMVVNAAAVGAVRGAFARLFKAGFPIRGMRLVDRYGGSDYASIQADNTSSFNCRNATGSSRWSEHAYGLAIDVDPIENPYVYADGTTSHAASRPYLNRHEVRPGMAEARGTLVRAFSAVGWGWGGRWPLPTDFQHFSVNGR